MMEPATSEVRPKSPFAPKALRSLILPFTEALILGTLLGYRDTQSSGSTGWTGLGYAIASLVLGFRHAGRAWPCWPPLGLSLYLAHYAAYSFGARQPFVEESLLATRVCLGNLFPTGILIGLGSILRIALASRGWFLRRGGPDVRLLPTTAQGAMACVAWAACSMFTLGWVAFESSTDYAPGFSEAAFNRIPVGMSAKEVEAMLGEPLIRAPRADGSEDWWYSRGITSTSDYQRREIFLRDGKVEFVLSDYWLD